MVAPVVSLDILPSGALCDVGRGRTLQETEYFYA